MNSNITLWLDHPITKVYRRLLEQHKQAHVSSFLNCGIVTPDKLPELAQIKGQINALDLMLNPEQLENFFDGELNRDN